MVGWLFCWNCLSELPKPKKLAVKLLAPFGSIWVGRSICLFFARHEGRLWQGECLFFLKSCKASSIAKVLWYHSVPFWPVPSHLYENIITVFGERYIEPKRYIYLWERPPGCTDRLAYSLKGMSATYIQLFCMYPWPFLAAFEVEVDGLAVSNEHTVTWWKDEIRWSLGWKNILGRSWEKCFRTWCTPCKPQLFCGSIATSVEFGPTHGRCWRFWPASFGILKGTPYPFSSSLMCIGSWSWNFDNKWRKDFGSSNKCLGSYLLSIGHMWHSYTRYTEYRNQKDHLNKHKIRTFLWP